MVRRAEQRGGWAAVRLRALCCPLLACGIPGCYVNGSLGVEGTVTEATTRAPVAGATVCAFDRLDNKGRFDRYRAVGDCTPFPQDLCTETDGAGDWDLRVHLPGAGRDEVWVIVCGEGYSTHEQRVLPGDIVESESDAVATLDVVLNPSAS